MFSDDALLCALRFFGSRLVMFSTDYPFTNMNDATAWLDNAPVDAATRKELEITNVARLLKL